MSERGDGLFFICLVLCASERVSWCLPAEEQVGIDQIGCLSRIMKTQTHFRISFIDFTSHVESGVNCGIESTPVGVATYYFAEVTSKASYIPWSRCVMVMLRL